MDKEVKTESTYNATLLAAKMGLPMWKSENREKAREICQGLTEKQAIVALDDYIGWDYSRN